MGRREGGRSEVESGEEGGGGGGWRKWRGVGRKREERKTVR